MKTGIANLPLHPGQCPSWLFQRMEKMAGAITKAISYEYSNDEFLRRISDPCWFQALGCVLGFDYHSSGVTTTTCGALKVALEKKDLGIKVYGGKGATSRKTPDEIKANEFNLSDSKINELVYSSKMSAKVDNNLVQDQFQLYHHCFFLTEKGSWSVVQQGMRQGNSAPDRFGCRGGLARRYHWLSDDVKEFVQPNQRVCCDSSFEKVLDLTVNESEETRKFSLDIVKDGLKELSMPNHHEILGMDLTERDMKVLRNAYELQPKNYEELVSLEGMGAKKIRALALISDLVYGSEASWKDPVKYSFAHGGKDGIPYPVDRQVYDNSIQFLENALEAAELEKKDKLYALKRLHEFI